MKSGALDAAKMARHLAALGIVVAGILYVAQNCGARNNVSSVNTLDNFAAGSQVFTNQCSASPDHRTRRTVAAAMAKVVILDADNRHPLTIATHDALTAVPDQLLLWSMRHYGTVMVTPQTAELCSAALTQKDGGAKRAFDKDSLAACFVYFPKTTKTREVLNFNVQNDPVEIQHALLKTFGSAISQLAPEVSPEIYKPLLAFERNVARAFVADLMDKQQGAFNITALAPLLGQFDRAALEAAAAGYAPGAKLGRDPLGVFSFDAAQNGKKYDNYAFNKKRFLDFTFAEAFDSYFCNNWGEFDEAKARAIARGERPLADAKDLVNTRKRMQVFFPRTHKVFAAGINDVLRGLDTPKALALTGGDQGFSLQGGARAPAQAPSRTVQYESPAWEGTKAFFGSIWGNTGGAAANAYGKYTERVNQSVNDYYAGGGTNVIAAVASGAGGGVAKTYEEEVAAPIRDQTEKRFNTQLQGGASINEAAVNSVLLAVGDQTGATPFLEGTYGVDTTDARFLSGTERTVRVAQGGLQLIDTATGVGGLVGVGKKATTVATTQVEKAAAKSAAAEAAAVIDVGDAFNGARAGTGLFEAAETATAGPKALAATKEAFAEAGSKGLAGDADAFLGKTYSNGQTRLESYAAGMSEDAAATTLKRGDKIYVVTDGANGTDINKLAWGAEKPPHPDVLGSQAAYDQFVKETALPDLKNGATRSNARVLELEVTADAVPAVNSTVQPNFGKQGGAGQTFLAYNKDEVAGSNLFKVVGDTADPAKPIGVYQQYDNFMTKFDGAMQASSAAADATRAFDQTATQAVRDWGVLTVANQGYQGAGDIASQVTTPPGTDLGPVSFEPFVEPQGAQPDALTAGAGGGTAAGETEEAH